MDTSLEERHALLTAQMTREYGYLMRFARSRIRDEHHAEDAVQETMVSALEGLASYDGRSTLRTWLTGILIHKIHDRFRRSARDGEVPVEEAAHPVDWVTPEHRLHAKQLGAAFTRALGTLPARQAEALVLREVSGIASEEICAHLGISNANFWVLVHRARTRLAAALEREGFGFSAGRGSATPSSA